MNEIRWYDGELILNKVLRPEHVAYLERFAQILHLPLREEVVKYVSDPLREMVGLPSGPQGLYVVAQIDPLERGDDLLAGIFDSNVESSFEARWQLFESLVALDKPGILLAYGTGESQFSRPYLSCDWKFGWDYQTIQWNQHLEESAGARFWLEFMLDHFLSPWGYEVAGELQFYEGLRRGRLIVTPERGVEEVIDQEDTLEEREEWPRCLKIYAEVSEKAQRILLERGCAVQQLSQEPPVILVSLPYDPGIKYDVDGYGDPLILKSAQVMLQERRIDARNPEWSGVVEMRLECYSEDGDTFLSLIREKLPAL